MTIDERLEAITMNLELQSHALEDHKRQVAEEMAAHRREVAAEMADFREKAAVLMTAVNQLVVASTAQTSRIEKIERRIA